MIKTDRRGHSYYGVEVKFLIAVRRTTAKVFAKNVFINQERKSEVRRRSDTVVVLTINDVN